MTEETKKQPSEPKATSNIPADEQEYLASLQTENGRLIDEVAKLSADRDEISKGLSEAQGDRDTLIKSIGELTTKLHRWENSQAVNIVLTRDMQVGDDSLKLGDIVAQARYPESVGFNFVCDAVRNGFATPEVQPEKK